MSTHAHTASSAILFCVRLCADRNRRAQVKVINPMQTPRLFVAGPRGAQKHGPRRLWLGHNAEAHEHDESVRVYFSILRRHYSWSYIANNLSIDSPPRLTKISSFEVRFFCALSLLPLSTSTTFGRDESQPNSPTQSTSIPQSSSFRPKRSPPPATTAAAAADAHRAAAGPGSLSTITPPTTQARVPPLARPLAPSGDVETRAGRPRISPELSLLMRAPRVLSV